MPFTYYTVTYTGTEAVRDWRKRILAVWYTVSLAAYADTSVLDDPYYTVYVPIYVPCLAESTLVTLVIPAICLSSFTDTYM